MGGSVRGRGRDIENAARRFNSAAGGAPIRLTINDDDAANTTGFDRLFAGFGATLDAFPEALRSAALPVVRQLHAENFAREAGRRPWAQLAEATVQERIRLGFPGRHPILRRTGALMRHVMGTPAKVTRTGNATELRIAPGASVGGVPKYRALARGRRGMPGRPMVVINAQGAVKVTSALSRYLRQKAGV